MIQFQYIDNNFNLLKPGMHLVQIYFHNGEYDFDYMLNKDEGIDTLERCDVPFRKINNYKIYWIKEIKSIAKAWTIWDKTAILFTDGSIEKMPLKDMAIIQDKRALMDWKVFNEVTQGNSYASKILPEYHKNKFLELIQNVHERKVLIEKQRYKNGFV